MKKKIILVLSILLCATLIMYCHNVNKKELAKQLSVVNDSILTNKGDVTVIGYIKNDNNKSVKVKKVIVTLKNDDEGLSKKVSVSINKKIKSKGQYEFKVTTKFKDSSRTFTDYEIVL